MITIRPSNLGRGAAAVAILLLMLSSNIAGTVKIQAVQPLPQAPASPPPVTPPQQSAPGELSYTNTWNRTQQAPICIQAKAAIVDPLKQKAQSSTITSSIPAVLAANSATSGQSTTYTYTAFANGTFTASDDQGNALSWKGVTGFPSGTTAIRLYGNSTELLQLYMVEMGGRTTANFTVTYKLAQTSGCEPHGVKVTIQGWVNWPGSSGGMLRIAFLGQQVSSNSTEVAFGGHGGKKLVFDWSDSMKQNPASFQAQTGVVSWSVGGNFKIDPTLVGTSSSMQAINWGDQRKLWHTVESNGATEYWAFYYDGSEIEKAYSLDGVVWHSSYLTSASPDTIRSGSEFASWVSISNGVYTLYYVLADPYTRGFFLGTGQLGDNGAVNSLVQTQFGTIWTSGDFNPCVYGSSTDVIVGIMTSNSGADQLEVYHISASTKQVISKMAIATGTLQDGCIPLGLTSGYALVYGAAATGAAISIITSVDGNAWSTPTTAPVTAPITMSSAVAMGNTLHFATVTNAGEQYLNCVYPCSTTSAPLTLASKSTGLVYDNVVLSTNARGGGASIAATYHTNEGVWERSSDDGGNSWTPSQTIEYNTSETIASGSLQGDYDYIGPGSPIVDTTDVAWVTGTSAPYEIWFPAFPVTVPSASSTPDPWAKSGYSPYESYFSQLNEYVSPGNGLLGVSQTDVSIPGRTPALSVTRVYSQPSDFFGTSNAKVPYGYDNYTLSNLGIGWELGFPWLTYNSGFGFLHPGNGAAIQLQFNSSNIMEYHGAIDFTLYHNSNNTFTLYTADGTKYVYNGLQLTSIISPDSPSNKLTFSYNASPGYITKIQDSEGRTVTFGYNSNNTLAGIRSGSRTWNYTYSGFDLSSVKDPMGRVTTFYYESYNHWLIKEIAYPTGAATYYTYDSGLVAPEVTAFAVSIQAEYSSNSLQLLARSNVYKFNMVDGSMVSSQVLCENATSLLQGVTVFDFREVNGKFVELQFQQDANYNLIGEVETDFDSKGREDQTVLYSAQGANLTHSVTHYDEWGNVNFTQDYNGHDTYSAYAGTKDQYQFGNGKTGLVQNFYTNSTISKHVHNDLLGTAEYQDTANSNTPIETFYLYNNNEVLRTAQLYSPSQGVNTWLTTSYKYDSLANLQNTTDSMHHETCYSYSPMYYWAYVTSETSSGTSNCYAAPNVSVAFAYDFATGEKMSQTDAEGNTTSYAYDKLGRVTTVSAPPINGVVAKTSYSYDDVNNIITITDPRGNITKNYYDGLGRLTQEQTYLSPSSQPYSTEFYTYNWLNQVLTDKTPNGATYRYSYDSLGRQTGVTNPDGSRQSATYDDSTNTLTITDGDGHQTQNVYDFMQNLVAVREYWKGNSYNATTYAYDGVGNLLQVAGPNGNQVTRYTYDDLNRLVKTTFPDGTTQESSYDSVGDPVNSTDRMHRVAAYTYDFAHRLSSVHYPDGSSTTYTYDNNGNVLTVTNAVDQVKYSYDALNRLLSETDVVGRTSYPISYSYDLAGNELSVTYPDHSKVTNTFDALDRVTKVSSGATTFASFSYSSNDTLSKTTYGNGEVTSYSYDKMNRPASIATSQGSTQELSLSYKYDGAGNVISINSESYHYDALNRLTNATGAWGTTTYSYDAAGNMALKQNSSSSMRYTYNNMDELVRSNSESGSSTYSYDGDGNLVIKNDGTNIWTYFYNSQGQMTKVLENGVLVQQNLYDGNGRRVEQTTSAGSTLYFYDGINILYEENIQTGVDTKHLYADGMQIASITTSATSFLHEDQLGSTRLVTNGNSPIFSSNYVPYGVQYGSTGIQEFKYTGQLYDAATGLYYFGNRFYDPSMGKFLTADFTGGVQSDPQSLNRYAYARDNPLAIVDPSGLSWNPLTWRPVTWLLLGAAVGLLALDAIQGGLDLGTNAVTADVIAEFVGSAITVGVSFTGLPIVVEGTETIGPDALVAAASSWGYKWDSGMRRLESWQSSPKQRRDGCN
ncbi:MAG: RHS repeat-associated core domain-containing protein [Nitrososphaerales archaeon]